MPSTSQNNCSMAIDSDLTVTYCEDGFIAIDSSVTFLKNTYSKLPKLSLKLDGAPRSV